jgi:hypothetical protein
VIAEDLAESEAEEMGGRMIVPERSAAELQCELGA